MSQTITRPGVDSRESNRTQQPWLGNVVLLDDDEHSYDYVIEMMQNLFAHPEEKAYGIAKTVDSQGRAVCMTTHKEHAELKRDQIHAFGKNGEMSVGRGARRAMIEPAAEQG